MNAGQIGDLIRQQIVDITEPVFKSLGFNVTPQDINNDIARFGNGLEATFYASTVENVQRKPFAEQAQLLKDSNKKIVEFKVKYKRPGKNVRFYLKVLNEEVSSWFCSRFFYLLFGRHYNGSWNYYPDYLHFTKGMG